MKNEAVSANQAVASGLGSTESNVTDLTTWLFDVAAFLLLVSAVAVSLESWRDTFSSPDRILFSCCVLAGLLIALARSQWQGDRTWTSVRCARFACVVASTLVCLSVAYSQPLWSAVACGFVVAGWGMGRIRGDTVFHGAFLGLALISPFAIDSLASLGLFGQLQPFTIGLTSLLADAFGEPHAREMNSIFFGKGTANQFDCIGVWDSVVGLLGVSFFCTLAFRRNLLSGAINFLLCFFVWAAVRSIAWVAIAVLASRYETWNAWSFELEIVLYLISAALVFSLDRLFAEVFRPIPFEYFNTETPLGSFVWNWLCGLPKLSLRIPKRNKISQRWRTLLHIGGRKPSFWTDFEWLRIEFFHLLRHPINAIGSVIDVVRGWKDSRKWKLFFAYLPAFLILTVTYSTVAFYSTRRNNSQSQFLSEESQKLCPTELLETASERQQEPGFCKAIKVAERSEILPTSISDSTKRQVELQSKRILAAFPSNGTAKYRLGLIYALNGETDSAEKEMNELVKDKPGDFPQADAWLAKTLIINSASGKELPVQKLVVHLDNVGKGKKSDPRLLIIYSRMLVDLKENRQAVHVAKQAVAANPDLILELAKIYELIDDRDEKIKTATEASSYFFAQKNSEVERDSNRLAIADAMLLAEKPDEAVKVLKEALDRKPDSDAIRTKLCSLQLLFYGKSIKQIADGKFELDMPLLEAAADTDPKDPRISSEVAKLLPFGHRPTKKLMDVLKSQVSQGIVSVPSLLMLGEAFYGRGNLESAKSYWESALEKEPDNYKVLNNLATCLIELSSSNAERAVEMVAKANSIFPNNADILDTWGDTLLAANRPREAVNKYELAIRIDNDRIVTRKKMIKAYEAAGMAEYATVQRKVLEEALKKKEKQLREKNAETPIKGP